MNRYLLPIVAFLAAFVLAHCGSPKSSVQLPSLDDRVDNFGLYDQVDAFHRLYYYSDAEAIVLYVHGNGCPIVRNGLPGLQAVRDEFAPQGVKFFMINSNLQDNRASIAQEAKDFGVDFTILDDAEQLVAEDLGIHRTAEAIVINPKNWKIVYRGPVDDRLSYETQKQEASKHYLADALTAHLKDELIAEAIIESPGCLVAVPYRERPTIEAITYTKDIAPLLKENCQTCHQEGGIAPWAMTGYDVVRGWSPMMREVLRTRRMPPWHADPHYASFSNDISLSGEERRKIVHWVEMGAPRGEGDDPLADLPGLNTAWRYGEPDLIIDLEPMEIPATGVIDYQYYERELPFENNKWVKAVEFMPDNRAALHHALVSVTYPDGFEAEERRSRWFDGLFATYAPGAEPEVAPEGSGRYLPAGSKLLFQVHYTTTGKPESDRSQLGIFFADEAPEKEFLTTGPVNPRLMLPPESKHTDVQAVQQFDSPITLYGMSPHMHFRGKAMTYTAIYPDGKEEVLLNVPNYNFNWQRYYQLAEPRELPAGTQLLVDAVFDNSSQNLYNPSPQDTVYWGEQSFEEMMIGYITYIKEGEEVAQMSEAKQ
ncbi:MAG: redoxin domain-containing protein [Bacteroidota bacterium]